MTRKTRCGSKRYGRTWRKARNEYKRYHPICECCKDEDGEAYGWGRVLDYIGIPWRDPAHWWLNPGGEQVIGQTNIFDYLEKGVVE